jgi:hypothetical protein
MTPCKVYFTAKGKTKVITANTDAELEALQRIGWKIEEAPADR